LPPPPPKKHKVLNVDFHNYFSSFGNNFIVGGDYNAKHQSWGCRSNNPRGCVLHSYACAKNLTVLAPPDPTYWPSSPRKNPVILDIFVTKIPSSLHSSAVNLLDLNSDHSSVLFTLNTIPLTHSEPPKLFNASTDHLKFHNLVNQGIKLNVKLKSTNDIDLAINNFTNLIQSAAWSSNSHTHHPLNQTSVPSDIRISIADKRRARVLFQRNRLPSLKHNYNKLSNLLKKMLAKHKASLLEKFLTNLSPHDGSLWKATKRTCKLNSPNIPIKKSDGSFVCTDLDKAELFKEYLYETFQPHPDIFSLENNIAVAESLNSPLLVSRPVKHFSPSEVKFVIDKYPHKKSPGFDLITREVARCLPKKAIIHLTHIFNCILRLSYFPILWKFSTIIMFPKPKKPPDSVSSFRPISLLPFFAKILEKLILKRIMPSISNSVLPDAQFGFRSAHSTIHQMHRIIDAISFSLEQKTVLYLRLFRRFTSVRQSMA